MNERDIERHSINCHNCDELIDERESYRIEIDGDDAEICQSCFENKGFTHCDVCDKTKPDDEIDFIHGIRDDKWYENICIKCWREEDEKLLQNGPDKTGHNPGMG